MNEMCHNSQFLSMDLRLNFNKTFIVLSWGSTLASVRKVSERISFVEMYVGSIHLKWQNLSLKPENWQWRHGLQWFHFAVVAYCSVTQGQIQAVLVTRNTKKWRKGGRDAVMNIHGEEEWEGERVVVEYMRSIQPPNSWSTTGNEQLL